jgi:hypothetical protein
VLNSVMQHVKGIVNGIEIPLQPKPLTARVVPPPVEPLAGPMGWITPGRMTGSRQTMPRGPGFTAPVWPVNITLDLLDLSTDPNIEQAYYLMVDAVFMALFTAEMPLFVTDPTTGLKSQLTAVSEDYGFTPGDWVTTANQRTVLFRGQVTATFREKLQTLPQAAGSG